MDRTFCLQQTPSPNVAAFPEVVRDLPEAGNERSEREVGLGSGKLANVDFPT